MKSIICKFQISSKTKTMGYDTKGNKAPAYRIEGFPVYTGSKEDEEFFQATPSGKLELGVLNKVAADILEPGDNVYITITKAEE